MEKNFSIASAAQQIDSGTVDLELASDLFQIFSESFEDEFESVHAESDLENMYLKRLQMYSSEAAIFQRELTDALSTLRDGRDGLYDAIRKGGTAV